ncbi:hypothetical protein M404DRAFT_714409 [Pisolithus tinctorius Marx 270]|uniref:Uncharacterized protein n=1 Tax=Pisolithus tinctorius Marx 270 TaxID=870435 RepID=A0A0C3IZE1_PISTI|nr:hypothetical protein M404DRAFT_714409 [Pisolithus tinctorius Marx 270]
MFVSNGLRLIKVISSLPSATSYTGTTKCTSNPTSSKNTRKSCVCGGWKRTTPLSMDLTMRARMETTMTTHEE